jgi:hypothetical protein
MIKKIAVIFGVVFLIVGICGFIPALVPNGHLLGIFHVNAAHNLIHLATGTVAVLVGLMSERASRIFFIVFGLVYGLVAVIGFMDPEKPILGMVAHNLADAWLHSGIAIFSLICGFIKRPSETRTKRYDDGIAGTPRTT